MKQDSLQKAEQPTVEVEKKRDRTEQTAEIEKRCAAAFGLKDGKVAFQILSQAANLQRLTGSEDFLDNFTKAFGTLSEIGPKGALEMLLAVQIMGVHQAALKFLANATVEGQTAEGRHLNSLGATRLMHLFVEQLEALQKLQGKHGQQKVTVEHVHVHQGGQAIVGAITRDGVARKEAAEPRSNDREPGKST